MTAQLFQPGEYVTIAYARVRVVTASPRILEIALPGVDAPLSLPICQDGGPEIAGFSVDRVAPVEWPPQHGDLWLDGHNGLWAARQADVDDDDKPYCELIPLVHRGRRDSGWECETVLQDFGPMRIEHRPSDSDGS